VARTAAGEALTEAHRAIQIRLATGLARDLAVLWRPVDPTDIRGTLEPFTRAGTAVTLNARRASASAAQTYYTMFRQVEGIPGAFSAALALEPAPEVLRGGLFGAGARGIMNGRRRGMSVTRAAQNGFVKASGAAIQIAANGGRETLLGAVNADPQAQGYQRVTDGDPCAFCQMIASRGIIAYDESSASFESHGHCGCTAEPAFEGSQISPRNATYRAEWEQATAGRSGADALSAFRSHLAGKSMPATG
jgi:hypothetical protein